MTNTDTQLTWDLSHLYQSMDDPAIEADFTKLQDHARELQKYRGTIATLTSEEMLKLIETSEEFSIISHKIGLYASLLESTHVGDPDVTRFRKKIDERMVSLAKETLFIHVEQARMPESTWQKHLNAPVLAPYHQSLLHAYRDAKHVLSEAEEKILTEKSQTSWNALSHLYDITTDTLEFDWDGNKITKEELLAKFSDPDPRVRKQTATVLAQGLEINMKTTPAIFNSLVQDKAISDNLRGYTYPEEDRYTSEDVEKETVEALIHAVNNRSDLVGRYYAIKRQLFNADKLYWWDRYAPLPEVAAKISIEEGRDMVCKAFHDFSSVTGEIADRMIATRHIDWLPGKTKRGGAFCAYGTQDGDPYVLLNYTEKPNDAMTLAHELGHAIHDVLARDNNRHFQAFPPLATAEIASVFSESLLFDRLLANPNLSDQDRISLLMGFIEDTFATVYRQVRMFQFEQAVHTKRHEEGELSKEQIDDLWHETMKVPFDSELVYTDEHKPTWMYVSHVFHSPFYVFSYAFAQLCVMAIYQRYKEEGEKFVPTYLELLKVGGSKSPKDTLAIAGFDISKPEFWQKGLDAIEDYINQLEKLTASK